MKRKKAAAVAFAEKTIHAHTKKNIIFKELFAFLNTPLNKFIPVRTSGLI